jgi:hypothetical protein
MLDKSKFKEIFDVDCATPNCWLRYILLVNIAQAAAPSKRVFSESLENFQGSAGVLFGLI